MARLKKAIMGLKHDKRLTRYNILNGLLDKSEHESNLAELKDLSDQCEELNLESDGASLDAFDSSGNFNEPQTPAQNPMMPGQTHSMGEGSGGDTNNDPYSSSY